MGRACKCCVCGEKLNTDTAFTWNHVTKGGNIKRFFFCSEDEYINQTVQIAMADARKSRLHNAINNILGYAHSNSMLFAQEKQWSEDDDIVTAIENHVDKIAGIMSYKGFDITSDSYRVYRYLSAIINNNINEWVSEVKALRDNEKSLEERVVEHESYKAKSHQKRTRKCLDDYD